MNVTYFNRSTGRTEGGMVIKMICGRCEQEKESTWIRRTNTAYVEEQLNYVLECDECYAETEEHWEMMWRDFGNGY